MKTIKQVIALVLLCTLVNLQVQGQSELSVESPLIDVQFSLPTADAEQIKSSTQKPTLIPQPLVLKHPKNGKCYAIQCEAGAGCESCGLFWKDRNGDGKINPRRELRCRCKGDPEKECRIQVKEVACHK